MTPPTIWQDENGNVWQDDGGQYFTDDPPLSVLSASVSWHVVGDVHAQTEWSVIAELFTQSGWSILTESSTGTSWGILDEIENGAAWAVLAESAIESSWNVLAEDEQPTSWAIADEIDRAVSWSVLTESETSAWWSILKEMSTSLSWDILQDGQMSVSLSWRILAEDDVSCGWSISVDQSAPVGWSILTEGSRSTGWGILSESVISSSWKILTEESVPISWDVDAINEVSAGIGWVILDEVDAQTGWSVVSAQSSSVAWSILNEQSPSTGWSILAGLVATSGWSVVRESAASIGWRIGAAELQAGISWSLLRQGYLSSSWCVLTERPVTLSWHDMAEIAGGVSWRLAGTNPAPETLGIDFASLLPPSIAYDPGIMAAAGGSSAAFTDTRNLIPEAVLYARIDELSSDALDHIAWGFHIDGWEFAETIERKRAFIKLFFDFHRYKGTSYGLRLYWRALINRLVLKIDPPGKSFLGTSMTQEERERFESVHPEVRVYPFRHTGAKRSLFCGDCTGDPSENYGVYPARTEALLRIGDRVTVYDPRLDVETEINRFEYDSVYVTQKATDTIEIRKPGNESSGGIFLGRFLEGETMDTGADQRLYTLTLDREYTTELERRTPLSIQPSLIPFRTTYETETEEGVAVGIHLGNRYPDDYPETGGSFIGQNFPVASNAAERVYKKLRLFDPDRVPGTMSTGRMTYLGAFRIGQQPPHTARVAVDMQGKRIPGAQFLSGYLRGRHLCTSDAETRIEQMRYVGKMAKRASDKVLISIRNRYEITTSSGLLTGTKKCGQIELEVI